MTKKVSFRFLPLVLFVLLLAFLLKGLFSDPNERDSALIGKPFPQFQLPDLNSDSQIHTEQTLVNEPVLINVWGTWCITCKYELPYLAKLAKEYDVKIVGLYYDQNHAPEFGQYADIPAIRIEVKEMLARLGNPYQYNILDLDRSLSLNLGVTGAPETFIVDGKGIVRMHHMGDVNERIWREKLAPIWNEINQ
ncbi:thiol:disulfide interchange protein [Psychrosphaera saromensis]|uniref:Thiol:disulfide interchange protein n=1 Tax=Psychrosphaera saromensis TaxID=716813 RepID=A0A2S7UYY5_9GAMM|nr:DsbE family thiol:disulfide interchange protein [Psychrosphaera saromensis]PQJ54712.1 thiol:disulfide interchange protein [Psychrosphaera saromensis]GHB57793.1 thiol:disulfide interchange protein [Psychrosphaera saromensis]GLQ14059.1 thiol:disulfide interchange protein [Psychrosphaera saromensis]